MNCPVCKNVRLVISDRQGVEIDYCPDCRGVWLDRGELDKIIERSDTIPVRQEYQEKESKQQHQSDRGYKKKKKYGGFLEDLFDF